MLNSDASQDTARHAHAAGKPSLMGEPLSAAAPARGGDKNTRMLFELESTNSSRNARSSRNVAVWLGAGVLVAAAAAGAWWSYQAPASASATALDSRAAESKPVSPAVNLEAKAVQVGKVVSQPTPAASAVIAVESSAARIETVTSAAAAPAVAAATTLVLASAASTALKTAPAESSLPVAAAVATTPKATKTPKVSKASRTAINSRQQKQLKQQLAQAKNNAIPAAVPVRVAKVASTPSGVGESSTISASKDADILLLSALLAHVSRDAQGASTATQAQQTIAQIVQRCETRGGKGNAESIECRRRICDGYWGKAQACPANLAPKKE